MLKSSYCHRLLCFSAMLTWTITVSLSICSSEPSPLSVWRWPLPPLPPPQFSSQLSLAFRFSYFFLNLMTNVDLFWLVVLTFFAYFIVPTMTLKQLNPRGRLVLHDAALNSGGECARNKTVNARVTTGTNTGTIHKPKRRKAEKVSKHYQWLQCNSIINWCKSCC